MKKFLFTLMMVVMALAISSCGNKTPDYENLSKEELVKLDEKGDIEATLQLGRNAIHDMNMEEAKTYFTKAADQDNPVGLHNLALINASEQQVDEVVNNLEKAARMDYIPSKGLLASVYLSHPEMNKKEEGLALAKEAANNNDKIGYYAMFYYHLMQQNKRYTEGDEVYRNMKKAIENGSSTTLYLMVLTDINGGMTAQEITAEMEPYKSSFPKLVTDLTALVNGDDSAFTSPYYQQGYLIMEDFLQ